MCRYRSLYVRALCFAIASVSSVSYLRCVSCNYFYIAFGLHVCICVCVFAGCGANMWPLAAALATDCGLECVQTISD